MTSDFFEITKIYHGLGWLGFIMQFFASDTIKTTYCFPHSLFAKSDVS